MELIVRDKNTGESKVFQPTKAGYAAAAAYRDAIIRQGHQVSDDGSNALSRIKQLFG